MSHVCSYPPTLIVPDHLFPSSPPTATVGNPITVEGEVMMPLGSQNLGGRSSNLSPLAPPFTLDKPYHKQLHNTNPPSNFTDQQYSSRFDRPRPHWNPSVNSFVGSGFMENSSKDEYPVSHQQSTNGLSSSTHFVPVSSAAGNVYDGFRYGQFTSSAPTIADKAATYNLPYVDNDQLPELVARNEPSYDLLSNFEEGQLSGSSQADDARTVSHVSPQWGGLWNGLNDVEQGRWLDLGGNYGPKDRKSSESSTGQKGTWKGSDPCGDRYNFHPSTLPAGSAGSFVEMPVIPTNCMDGFRGENKIGPKHVEDRKSFKEGATTVSRVKISALGSVSADDENYHLNDQFLQDIHLLPTEGIYEGPVDSQDKYTSYADTYMCESTSTVRSPTQWSAFRSPQYDIPSTAVNSFTVSNGTMDKTKEPADFRPYHPFGLNFQVSSYTGNTESLFTGSSCTKMEDYVYKNQVTDDCLDQLMKTNSASVIPHLSVAEFAKVQSDTADTFYSVEKYTDNPDIQNTAEDSPCWKGAHFSPFEDCKVAAPVIVSQKTESCLNPDIEEHTNNPTEHDSTDTIHVPGEVNGNTNSKWFSNSNHASREHDDSCFSMTRGLHSPNLYGGNGFQLFDKNHVLDLGTGNDLSLFNYSAIPSSSKSSHKWQINSEVCVASMPVEIPQPSVAETVAEMKGKFIDTHLSGVVLSSPTNAGDHPFCSPLGNDTASMAAQLSANDSKVDICVLVNTMKDMSEVLASQCSNSHSASSELDYAALKLIISNLNSCLVKKADQATQTEKCDDQLASKVTTAHTDQNDVDFFSGWKGDTLYSSPDLSDSSFLKGDAEEVRDAQTIQDIKKVLDVNFSSEDMQPETTLYKNLWLETEAALCARTVRSRFNRLKIETEKKDQYKNNDVENVAISNASDANKVAPHEGNDSPSSSRLGSQTDMESSLIGRFRTLTSLVEDLQSAKVVGADQTLASLANETIHMPTFACSSTNPQSQASDIETSVMDRFKTLMSRIDNSGLKFTEDEKSPSNENFRPPSPDQYSYFSSMANNNDGPDAAVLSRLNILKTRIQQSEAQNDAPQFMTSFLSAEDRSGVHSTGENIKDYSSPSVSSISGKLPRFVNGVGDELLEGWYDCSEPGWEHVTKEGSPKQK